MNELQRKLRNGDGLHIGERIYLTEALFDRDWLRNKLADALLERDRLLRVLEACPKLMDALKPFADHGRVLREAGCEPSDQWCEVEGGRWTHWLAVQHFIDAADAIQAILDAKGEDHE